MTQLKNIIFSKNDTIPLKDLLTKYKTFFSGNMLTEEDLEKQKILN
jgi:hypothetical protein